MEHLYKHFETKAAEDNGTISGYFSTYDRIPDSYGDVIAPGAFTETIKAREESGHPFPLCWNHNLDQIIGKVDSIEDTEKGPLMTASFFDTPLAQEKREIVKSGVVYQFSFAYDVKDAAQVTLEDGTKANELRQIDLFEVSIVPIPANPRAEMTSIKSDDIVSCAITGCTTTTTTFPYISTGTETIWASGSVTIPAVLYEPAVKSGRRNSKKDADALKEAISLIQGVLGEFDEELTDEGEDEVKANAAAEEPEQSNPEKERLLEYIKSLKMEDDNESEE